MCGRFLYEMMVMKLKTDAGSVPFETLERAFGSSSLGIIIVSGLPTEFPILRERLLTSASHLAQLPSSALGKPYAMNPVICRTPRASSIAHPLLQNL